MSHDRGCFKCGEEFDYHLCEDPNCPKADLQWVAEKKKKLKGLNESYTGCKKCDCLSCTNGYENHEHYCTRGPECIEKKVINKEEKAPANMEDELLIKSYKDRLRLILILDEQFENVKKEFEKRKKELDNETNQLNIAAIELTRRNLPIW